MLCDGGKESTLHSKDPHPQTLKPTAIPSKAAFNFVYILKKKSAVNQQALVSWGTV